MRSSWTGSIAFAVAGIAAIGGAMHFTEARAESALQFMLNGGAARFGSGPSRYVPYSRDPQPVQRALPEYGTHEQPRSRGFERVVCERVCDGRRLVMAIQTERRDHSMEEAMCRAAGGDAEIRFRVEQFLPGRGAEYAAAELQTGRAATSTPCPDSVDADTLGVPILHDATLRSGDIVATPEGFKVFRGRGSVPHRASDFVALDQRRLESADFKRLEVATIP